MQFIWNEEGKSLVLKEFPQQHISLCCKADPEKSGEIQEAAWPSCVHLSQGLSGAKCFLTGVLGALSHKGSSLSAALVKVIYNLETVLGHAEK